MAIIDWIQANSVWIAFVFSILVLVYYIGIAIKTFKKRRRIITPLATILTVWGLLFFIYVVFMSGRIEPTAWGEIILLGGLVSVTAAYAYSTERMAEEMRKQMVIASRPVIIQKAQQKKTIQATIVTDYFSHFEIYNAGNGPAIEPEIFLLDEERNPIFLEDEITYLRAGEAPLKLVLAEFGKVQSLPNGIEPPVKVIPIHLVIRGKRTYLVSQYQSIFSYGWQSTWYQTWLPFESHKINGKEEIRLIPGKLEFHDKVTEKERIIMPLVKGKPK